MTDEPLGSHVLELQLTDVVDETADARSLVFKVPDGNHRSGGLFEVTVHIKMPGGTTVDIDRTPGLDERFAEAQFAVTDAFRRARRSPIATSGCELRENVAARDPSAGNARAA